MSPRPVRSTRNKTNITTKTSETIRNTRSNTCSLEDLAVPLDDDAVKHVNLKQTTLNFPVRRKPADKPKKSQHAQNTGDIEVISTTENNCDENVEIAIEQTPTKSTLLSTPKRKLFIGDESGCSPSKRNCSPSTGKQKSQTTPSSLLNQLDINDGSHVESNTSASPDKLRPKCLFQPSDNFYSAARKALHSSQPSSLPGREDHLEKLHSFLLSRLQGKCDNKRGSIYISGAPGTGKTACVNLTLQLPEIKSGFKMAYINCTSVKNARSVFVLIAEELGISINGKSEKDCITRIQNYITCSKRKLLLVLDEVDELSSRYQYVLYTVFEWPVLAGSQLTLIGIANSLDLTDRLLPRLQARASYQPILLHYAPYTKQQIADIIKYRLEQAGVSQVFKGLAVEMLAAKVAAVSGDARRALDIGRRVIELADIKQSNNEKVLHLTADHGQNTCSPRRSPRKANLEPVVVGIMDVKSVLDGVYGTSQSLVSSNAGDGGLPLQQKLMICSLLLVTKKGNNKVITVGKLNEIYCRVCRKRNMSSVSQSEFFNLCNLVETRGIVCLTVAKKELRKSKIALQWDEEELAGVLCDKDLMASILDDVSCLTGR